MPSLDVGGWIGALHAGASPQRVYARTQLGAAAPRYWLLTVDPSGLNPNLPAVTNGLDVDGAGVDDLAIRVTPTLSGPAETLKGVVVKVVPLNAAQPLVGLRLDLGVRLDGPLTPPDGAADAEFVVVGIDAGPHPLAANTTAVVTFESTGTPGTVGSTATTTANVEVDAGGALPAADHPLVLHIETHAGASRTQNALLVLPVGPTTSVQISVPDEAGPVTEAGRIRAELRRPELRPHLVPGVMLTWLTEVRAVEAAETVTRDRFTWESPHDVTLVLVIDDDVTARHRVIETATLPPQCTLDVDLRRATATVPHIQYDGDAALGWLRLRDDQPASASALRYLAVHALGIPDSVGLRLDIGQGAPLRVVLSRHESTEDELPEPLGGLAVLLGRDAAQLPPNLPTDLPRPVDLAEQTVAVDIDDVGPSHPFVPPRLFVSGRAAKYARVQEKVPAPEPAHANDTAGLVVDVRLGADTREDADGVPYVLPHRAFRLQVFRRLPWKIGEPWLRHTRLVARAGSLPDRTVVDLRTEPAGYFGLRVWGTARWVRALYVDGAASATGVRGAPMRLHVTVPRTPEEWVDVRSERGKGLFVTATEPTEAEVELTDTRGVDPDGALTRVLARVAFDHTVELPAAGNGLHVVAAERGASGRFALTGPALPPLAVRATPQVVLQARAEPPALEAVTGRVYGLTELRQGGDPGFVPGDDENVTALSVKLHVARVNRALRIRQRARPDVAAAARDVLKLAVADFAEEATFVTRDGRPVGDERSPAVVGVRRASVASLRLSRQTGRAVVWSEPEQLPWDGPRSAPRRSAGIGVTWLSIDALPRRLEVAPLHDGRYVGAAETRPANWPGLPSTWTRDGMRISTSHTLTVREMLQANWDREKTDGSTTMWSLSYVRLLELATDPLALEGPLATLWVWNPSRRLDDAAFAEPEAVLGVRVSDGARFTLDLDKYEQRGDGTPHWDALPAVWPLRAEIQFEDFEGQVTVGDAVGMLDKSIDGAGPGLWWVRSKDAWLSALGGGSAALGNTGGPDRFHQQRIFP